MPTTMPGGYNNGGQPLYRQHGGHEPNRLLNEARDLLSAGRTIKTSLSTVPAVEGYQVAVRSVIQSALGAAPATGPLNVNVTGTLARNGYRVEKLTFESLPCWLVSANLYIPDSATPSTPAPGVVGLCGHASVGKAEASYYQRFAQGLVRLGFIVLMIDSVGMGERNQYSNAPGTEHLGHGQQLPLIGWSEAGLQVHDASRAVSVLLDRPEVDPAHIGVTGNSGGGIISTLLTGLDARLTMAAPSCWGTDFQSMIESQLPGIDHEQMPPELIAAGLDVEDLWIAYAPRHLSVIAQQRDYFRLAGIERAHAEAARIYGILGKSENIRLHIGQGDHGFHKDGREAMYSHFVFAATGNPAVVAEPAGYVAETEADLFATPNGTVFEGCGRRIESIMAERASAFAVARGTPTGPELQLRILDLLKLPSIERTELARYSSWEQNSQWSRDGNQINGRLTTPQSTEILKVLKSHMPHTEASGILSEMQTALLAGVPTPPNYPRKYGCTFMVETEPGAVAPLYYFHSDGQLWHSDIPPATNGRATLYVSHDSVDQEVSQLSREPLLNAILAAEPDTPMFGVDVRGVGEQGFQSRNAYADDFFASVASMIDQPMLGRKVWDLLRVLDLLEAAGHDEVHVIGRGFGAIPAALASVLHDGVAQVTLTNALTRWEACARAKPNQMAIAMSVLPRHALISFDLPDVYAELTATKGLVQHSTWGAWKANPAGEF